MKSGDLESMTSYGNVGQQFGLGSAGHRSAVGLQFCPPGSAGSWLGNMAPGLHVSHHPAGRPQLAHTRKREASKSSKRASSRAGALCKPLLVSCLQMSPWPKQDSRGMLTQGLDSTFWWERQDITMQGHTYRWGRELEAIVIIYHIHINGWHLRILYLSARTHLGIVPNTMGYFWIR